jgi:hypothetical protein
MIFGLFTLLVAITISAVAAYYSIVGLTAIFSAAVIPIIIMGAALEVGKVTAAVWLKMYWARASITYKLYLVPAVAFLMLLTSMGIFGYLSKAHSDQNLVSGDSTAKVAIYDEKIKTEKENIEANRKALKQMDEGVDQVLGRSTDEKGADKAVALRRAQQKERVRLQTEILQSQKLIAELNDARAPLAAEVRKVEAEVGPIKYIAALIYGDNPDANVLERAVRWVIIIIVAVFDPLALVLILAAQQSLRWAREDKAKPAYEQDDGALSQTQIDQIIESADTKEKPTIDQVTVKPDPHPPGWMFREENDTSRGEQTYEVEPEKSLEQRHPYLFKPFVHFKNLKPMVYKEEANAVINTDEVVHAYDDERLVTNQDKEILAAGIDIVDRPGDYLAEQDQPLQGVKRVGEDYFEVGGKKMHQKVFEHDFPQLASAFKLQADNVEGRAAKSSFGLTFPNTAEKGEMFLRVDYTPNKLFKYNGTKWIEVDKERTDSYTYDRQYILFLIEKLKTGEYDIDQLSATEQELVAEELKIQQNDQT